MALNNIENFRLKDGNKIDNLPSNTTNELSLKVDKVAGKSLIDDTKITKLDGIEAGAEVNITEQVTAGTNITINRVGKDITISSTATGGVSDHGLLSGLSDDDHTQYHNDTRGDARYNTKSEITSLLSGKQNTLIAGTNITIVGDTISSTATGGATTLDGLTDVVITTPTNGQALIYDGTQWENTTLPGGGDMLKSTYDTNANGKVDVAEVAEAVDWNNVTNKPSTFTPTSHTHDDRYYTETEVDTLLSGKAPSLTSDENYVTDAEKASLPKIEGVILNNTDANTVTSGGRYGMTGTPTNGAISGEFALDVTTDGTRVMQIATYLTGVVYTRYYTGSVWSSWVKYSDDAKASLSGATFTGAISATNLSGTNTGDNAVNTLYSGLATSKQDTLVSGTNIKTINGTTILGSGDIVISGGVTPLRITIPGEQIADTANYQGMYFYNNSGATRTISDVDIAVGKARAGTGRACAVNLYKSSGTRADGINTNAVNLFTSAIDLGTGYTSLNNVPNTTTVENGKWLSLRVTSSAGAINKASDLQVVIIYS